MAERILVLINTLSVGGAETFIMKVFRATDPNKFVYDFLINDQAEAVYEKEVIQLGGKVYHGYFKVEHPIKNLWAVYKTVKAGGYKKVFVFSQHPVVFLNLLMATLGGAKVRVVRSTNSACGGRFSTLLATLFRPLMNLLVTKAVAPSKEAAEWLFGKGQVRKGRVAILKNGLDLNEYHYSEELCLKVKSDLGYGKDDFVVGHVGRFNQQKNHLFLVDVFATLYKKNPKAKLMLLGKGETMPDVKKRVEEYGLSDVVAFMGVRSDVSTLLHAMDVFVFPSLYEGLPNVIVEAQATGIPCMLSDTISKDVGFTKLVRFESLQSPIEVWVEKILKLVREQPKYDTRTEVEESGYAISSTVKFLETIFN